MPRPRGLSGRGGSPGRTGGEGRNKGRPTWNAMRGRRKKGLGSPVEWGSRCHVPERGGGKWVTLEEDVQKKEMSGLGPK